MKYYPVTILFVSEMINLAKTGNNIATDNIIATHERIWLVQQAVDRFPAKYFSLKM